MKPIRIQRKRMKGWRLPPNTVCVTRGCRWGNPYAVHAADARQGGWVVRDTRTGKLWGWAAEKMDAHKIAVRLFAQELTPYTHHGEHNDLGSLLLSAAVIEEIQRDLKGKNIACWCGLNEVCHGDWLLDVANNP